MKRLTDVGSRFGRDHAHARRAIAAVLTVASLAYAIAASGQAADSETQGAVEYIIGRNPFESPPSASAGMSGGLAVVRDYPEIPRQYARKSFERLKPVISAIGEGVGLDPQLIAAVIDVESGFNAQAVSAKGARGLMQLMPGTGADYGVVDLFNPVENIAAGAAHLAKLVHRFGAVELALAAYNAGEGAVMKSGFRVPGFRETQSYVPRVLDRYQYYRRTWAPDN